MTIREPPREQRLRRGSCTCCSSEVSAVNNRSSRRRALGIGSEKPFALTPGIPSISEAVAGLKHTCRDYARLPATRLTSSAHFTCCAQAIKSPRERAISARFVEGVGSGPGDFRAFVERGGAVWEKDSAAGSRSNDAASGDSPQHHTGRES